MRKLTAEVLARYPRLDMLINNAGAMYGTRQLSADGIELTWAVNHLGPFLLTMLLLDRLKASAPARIITTASGAHQGARIPFDDVNAERSYRSFGRYGEPSSQTSCSRRAGAPAPRHRRDGPLLPSRARCHGLQSWQWAADRHRHDGPHLVARTPAVGADTMVWLATSPDVANVSGNYFFDRRQRMPGGEGQDLEVARRLWALSEQQCGL